MEMKTKNCVRCLKQATIWSGHVIDYETKEEIIAGWCGHKCYEKSVGFKGLYKKEMEKIDI